MQFPFERARIRHAAQSQYPLRARLLRHHIRNRSSRDHGGLHRNPAARIIHLHQARDLQRQFVYRIYAFLRIDPRVRRAPGDDDFRAAHAFARRLQRPSAPNDGSSTSTASLRRASLSIARREVPLPISSSEVHRKHNALCRRRTSAPAARPPQTAPSPARPSCRTCRARTPVPRDTRNGIFAASQRIDRVEMARAPESAPRRPPFAGPVPRAHDSPRCFCRSMLTVAPRRRHSAATIAPKRSTAALSWLGDSHAHKFAQQLSIAPSPLARVRSNPAWWFANLSGRFLHPRMLTAASASAATRIADSHPRAFRIELQDCASTKSAAVSLRDACQSESRTAKRRT